MSVVLAPSPSGVPTFLHWGADLGELSADELTAYASLRGPAVPQSAIDEPRHTSVLPESAAGFTGTPAVEGMGLDRLDHPATVDHPRAWAPRFTQWQWGGGDSTAELQAQDEEAGVAIRWTLEVTAEGLVRVRSALTNIGSARYVVSALRGTLPVPAEASELLDLTGRWCRERTPQRHAFQQGSWQRSGRHGRTGHDATLLLVAGSRGFGFTAGRVWGVHVAWSGDHVTYAERTAEGESVLGGGELLAPAEVVLEPGESYTTPWLIGAYSDQGLDGLSDRLHRWQRRRSPRTRRLRPVVLNTWEAVYFEHDLARLTELADAGAEVGIERFVLDDGWFRGRRHDRAGLGDWMVDEAVWPDGLHRLIDHVRGRGMEFGLWVEPEMVNEDSDIARTHPDWLLRGRSELPHTWRHQQVLDLQNPKAYGYVREALLALLHEYDIAFLKWDHNRDLIDVAHRGRPAVHGQTTAFYRLLDEIRTAHPHLEVESCASGGARVDLGVLQHADRVWASDTLDPLLRTDIQRWTALLVPPELVGAHVGGPVSHTTGRTSRIGFRAAVALLGHFGVEWDLSRVSEEERKAVASWVSLHKEIRHLVAEGRMVRPDHADEAVVVTGMVAQDGGEAVYVVLVTDTTRTQVPTPVHLTGLDPFRRYRVEWVEPTSDQYRIDRISTPDGLPLGRSWFAGDSRPVVTTGMLLGEAGITLPPVAPESAFVLRVKAVDGGA